MDKQQAAANYSQANYGIPTEWLPATAMTQSQFDDHIQLAHTAGWEAHEAQQTPSDVVANAIAFAEWIRESEYHPRDMSDKPNWFQAGSKVGWLQPGHSIVRTTRQLYTLFNPSGAAPQSDSTTTIVKQDDRYFGDRPAKEEENPLFPPAAGPVTGFAILYEALDNIAHSTAFPISEEQCYSWIQTAQEMADKAIKAYNSESRPPAPAGPVWVKAEIAQPKKSGKYIIRLKVGGIEEVDFKINQSYFGDAVDVWLDETHAPQVFTREQVQEIVRQAWLACYKENCPDTEIGKELPFKEADHWFNEKYPQS